MAIANYIIDYVVASVQTLPTLSLNCQPFCLGLPLCCVYGMVCLPGFLQHGIVGLMVRVHEKVSNELFLTGQSVFTSSKD